MTDTTEVTEALAWARCLLTMTDDTECIRVVDDDDGPGCGECERQVLVVLTNIEKLTKLTTLHVDDGTSVYNPIQFGDLLVECGLGRSYVPDDGSPYSLINSAYIAAWATAFQNHRELATLRSQAEHHAAVVEAAKRQADDPMVGCPFCGHTTQAGHDEDCVLLPTLSAREEAGQ